MKKNRHSTLEGVAEKMADFLAAEITQDNLAEYLKVTDALARLEKAMIEVQLLKEDLRKSRHERASRRNKTVRQAGISPEAQAEIDALLGLGRVRKASTAST